MTAGLFARHGVFFGNCGGPNQNNTKGNWENGWMKRGLKSPSGRPNGWPDSWFDRMREEGWNGQAPWGLKAVAVHWPIMRQLEPDVVVLCYRPKPNILDSCERFGSGFKFSRKYRDPMIDMHWALMETIRLDYPGTVVEVNTPDLVKGDYDSIRPAFDALGVEFDEEVAGEWIDPALFTTRRTA